MSNIESSYRRDANGVPITNPLGLMLSKTITYAALTTGAVAVVDLFTVTGDVMVNIFAICSDDLTSGGGATIEVGITGNTPALIAQSVATTIDKGEIWTATNPPTVVAVPSLFILTGTNIQQKVATTTITGGTLKYYCFWQPLSDDGNVVAA